MKEGQKYSNRSRLLVVVCLFMDPAVLWFQSLIPKLYVNTLYPFSIAQTLISRHNVEFFRSFFGAPINNCSLYSFSSCPYQYTQCDDSLSLSLQNCFGFIQRGLKAPSAASFVEDGGAIAAELLIPKLTRSNRRIDTRRLHSEHDMDWRRELWFSVKQIIGLSAEQMQPVDEKLDFRNEGSGNTRRLLCGYVSIKLISMAINQTCEKFT